jgi:hypothetical protein
MYGLRACAIPSRYMNQSHLALHSCMPTASLEEVGEVAIKPRPMLMS